MTLRVSRSRMARHGGYARRTTVSSGDAVTDLIREAVLYLDTAQSVAGEQVMVNQGTGGAALNARYGSTTGVDSNDPTLRVRGQGEPVSIYLPGVAGGYLSNSQSVLGSLASLEFAVRVSVNALGVTNTLAGWQSTHAAFYMTSANKLAVYVLNTPGFAQIGGAVVSSVAVPGITAGVPIWLKGKVTVADAVCEYWYSNDDTNDASVVSWTSVGTPQTGTNAGTTPVLTDSSALLFGCHSVAIAGVAGKIYAGQEKVDGVERCRWTAAGITSGSATSFPATVGGTVTIARPTTGLAPMVVNRNLLLFGTDDYLEIPYSELLNVGAGQSFTALVAARQWSTTGVLLSNRTTVDSPQAGWALVRGSTTMGGRFSDGVTNLVPSAATTLGLVGLNALVRDTSADTLQVTGSGASGAAVADTTTGSAESALKLTIGAKSGGGSYASMELAVVGFWRRALTATELATIATSINTGWP